MAVNPTAGRLYIEDYFSNILTVVNEKSNSVVTRIALPADANNGLAVDNNTGMVYALVQGGVAVINGTSNKVAGELSLDFGPGALAYDGITHVLYGSEGGLVVGTLNESGRLIGVNVMMNSIVANISLGYWADSLAINQDTHMVYAVGCANSFVCGAEISVVNGTSRTLVTTVKLGSDAYPRVAVDPRWNLVYVSGTPQLYILDGYGDLVYVLNSQSCSPFDSMTVVQEPGYKTEGQMIVPLSNQLLAVSLDYDYILAYDGTTGALVNMYSFPSSPQYVTFNPTTSEVYVTTSTGQLLTFSTVAGPGHVNSTLVGSGKFCPLP
jgi:DNA-binding beta-propeller fold protein YncE